MDPTIYEYFESLLRDEQVTGSVLEIGALPDERALLASDELSGVEERVGLDLSPGEHPDFELIEGNANDMQMFNDDSFDCVLCNAVLEHDPEFWLTLKEIQRVASPGAFVAIGVPGYTTTTEKRPLLIESGVQSVANAVGNILGPRGSDDDEFADRENDHRAPTRESSGVKETLAGVYRHIAEYDRDPKTPVYAVHAAPDDYYRFSESAIRDVLLKGLTDKHVAEVLKPPRLIGSGRVPE